MCSLTEMCAHKKLLLFALLTLLLEVLATTTSARSDFSHENNFIDSATSSAENVEIRSGKTQQPTIGSASNGDIAANISNSRGARALLSHSDEYVARNQKRCFESRQLVSCIKYKAAKIIWKLATNSLGYFPNEYSRELREDKRRIRFIQLGEPADVAAIFSDARSVQGDNELTSILKFLKRAAETFGRNHGFQVALSSDTGARITSSEVESRARHDRKRRKWLIILPLIILMKIAHLKMSVVTLLLGVLGLNVLLVGGTGWLIHYLKFKTLCKIHPHLVHSHSHVYDSDPADYSSFVGSSYPGSYYSNSGGGPHEVSSNGFSKDWGASSKAYHGHNYLDTISKRLK